MSTTPWYKAFFGEDYLRIYGPFLPPSRTEREVAEIINLLQIAPGSSILDLCCGYGRHTLPLAQRGYQMTGLDLSEAFLQQAQTEAAARGVEVRWLRSDMRTIPFENEFDAVINIFTSFGYLEDENDDRQVLQQVGKALKPGGRFILETICQTRVIRSFTPYGILRYEDGLIVLEERHINLLKSRNEIHITLLYPDGHRKEHDQSIRIYTLTELTRMLAAAGLEVLAYYGDLDGSPLTMDSRLTVLSQKIA
ncbi:class I SAM-dependent methyltransferase [Ktedonosporobacter rubrisoli]|uniref:Class I SAM-dependent methyltransferase n=1 Tax=Ktedonosporobacter rubrisoli TaxID=2509675 RepID=A0A4P6JTJ3_KTERU|nr:class I SAM-dependent methyltransferase [Ktedonosporobacter rubrisoli]QBD78226.1 class I SAM-dependent methyltransferase [Ktedonosporobacter rubrisoli]